MNNHVDASTRYDILILAGDYGNTSPTGPNFQYNDVGTFDLHLTGATAPDSISVGDNLRIVATVNEFDRDSCLFVLEPVSTEVR